MAGTTQYRSAGFAYAWYGQSTAGVPGVLADLVGGASDATGLTRMPAAQSADFTFPEDDIVPIEGDDGIDGQFNFTSTELVNFTLTVGRGDMVLTDTIQGTSQIDLQSTWTAGTVQPKDRDFTDMFLLLTRRAQNTSSSAQYENFIFPLCTMTYLGTAFSSREAGVQNYQVTCNRTSKTWYGTPLSASVGGKDEVTGFRLVTDYPIMIDVWEEDGTATSFTASQTPRTSGTHLGWTWDETTSAATTKAITKSSDTFTFTAGTDDELIIATYEFE